MLPWGDDDELFYGLEDLLPIGPARKRRRFRFPFDEGFGQMFREMMEVSEALGSPNDLPQGIPPELVRKKKLPDGTEVQQFGPIIFGYSMTVDESGQPVIRQFGNVNPNLPSPLKALQEKREPLVDVINEGDTVKIVAELAGVKAEEINVVAEDDGKVLIETTGERKYHKVLSANTPIDSNSGVSNYKNGILEITFQVAPSKPKGKQIKVE